MTGVQTCALPICFPVTIEAWKIVYGSINLPDADGNPTETEFQQAIGYVGADYPYPEGNDYAPSYPVVAHKEQRILEKNWQNVL